MPIYLDIQGIKQLRVKLGQFGGKINEEGNRIIEEIANETLEDTRLHAPKDLGGGARNMYVENYDLGAAVISPDIHMAVQEFGRTPGAKQPSTDQVAGWGTRHGFTTKHSIFLLARSIGAKGFRGKLFMTGAAERANIRLRQKLNIAGTRIVAWFE